jgi:hypothetical protein
MSNEGGSATVTAAVNDGAIMSITFRQGSNNCAGGTVLANAFFGNTEDVSQFRSKTVDIPSDTTVTEVCVTLSDDPDANFSGVTGRRTSALLDRIEILDFRPPCDPFYSVFVEEFGRQG